MQLKSGDLLLNQKLTKILILQKRVMRLMTFNDVFPTIPGPLRPDPIFVILCCMKVEDLFYKYQGC